MIIPFSGNIKEKRKTRSERRKARDFVLSGVTPDSQRNDVELRGVEPRSKQGTRVISTCLSCCWFS